MADGRRVRAAMRAGAGAVAFGCGGPLAYGSVAESGYFQTDVARTIHARCGRRWMRVKSGMAAGFRWPVPQK